VNHPKKDEVAVGKAGLSIDTIIIDPFGDIRRAKERKDWPAGLSASVTYFKHFGTIKLKGYFKHHGIGLDEKTREVKEMFVEFIGGLTVDKMITLLYCLDIIDESLYNQMKEVNSERNKLLHPEKKGIAYRFHDEERFARLLDQASRCVETLSHIRVE